MSFPWSKKVSQVVPITQPEQPKPEEVTPQQQPQPDAPVEIELTQTVELPVVDDKISSIEHKNGECLVSTCKKDDEAHEGEGDLRQGQGVGTSDQGGQEDLAWSGKD